MSATPRASWRRRRAGRGGYNELQAVGIYGWGGGCRRRKRPWRSAAPLASTVALVDAAIPSIPKPLINRCIATRDGVCCGFSPLPLYSEGKPTTAWMDTWTWTAFRRLLSIQYMWTRTLEKEHGSTGPAFPPSTSDQTLTSKAPCSSHSPLRHTCRARRP